MRKQVEYEVKYVDRNEMERFYCQHGFREAVIRALNYAYDNNIKPNISFIRNDVGTTMKSIEVKYFLESKDLNFKHHPIPKSEETNFDDVTDIKELDRGDIVKHKISNNTYLIDANYGNSATGISTININNPSEWRKLKK